MILFDGKCWDSYMQESLLDELEKKINRTRMNGFLSVEVVLNAAEKLKDELMSGKLNFLTEELDEKEKGMLSQLYPLLDKENLRKRVKLELNELTQMEESYEMKRVPLGTLFHIAAGNMDGLPAYSVLEGLLSGNINILKLPSIDHSLSISILHHLIEIEPLLKDYIYVFDTPSSDAQAIYKMASVADGLVVWGGDQAISAIRKQAPIGIKLIEWGHRISFVYISARNLEERKEDWIDLAEHLVLTRQQLCSSAQVIYLDTDSQEEAKNFVEMLLPILDQKFERSGLTIQEQGEMTLRKTTDHLRKVIWEKDPDGEIFWGNHCSILLGQNRRLEGCGIPNQIVVKCLPKEELLETLREKKGYLQTAGLICEEKDVSMLSDLLIRSGVNRIMSVKHMSSLHVFDSHDGEFSLNRYTRIVKLEKHPKN